MTCQFACVSSDWLARYMCSFEAQPPWWTLGRQAIHLPLCAGSRGSRWTPALLRRVSLKLTSEYFRGIWSSIRELVLMETLDDRGKPQGAALVHMDQLHQVDGDGGLAKVTYIGCSYECYQWWVDDDMGPNVFHHFCRASSLHSCMDKVVREGLVHAMQWTPMTRPEAEQVLREWQGRQL